MTVELTFDQEVVVVIGGTSGINQGVAVANRNAFKVEETIAALECLGWRPPMDGGGPITTAAE